MSSTIDKLPENNEQEEYADDEQMEVQQGTTSSTEPNKRKRESSSLSRRKGSKRQKPLELSILGIGNDYEKYQKIYGNKTNHIRVFYRQPGTTIAYPMFITVPPVTGFPNAIENKIQLNTGEKYLKFGIQGNLIATRCTSRRFINEPLPEDEDRLFDAPGLRFQYGHNNVTTPINFPEGRVIGSINLRDDSRHPNVIGMVWTTVSNLEVSIQNCDRAKENDNFTHSFVFPPHGVSINLIAGKGGVTIRHGDTMLYVTRLSTQFAGNAYNKVLPPRPINSAVSITESDSPNVNWDITIDSQRLLTENFYDGLVQGKSVKIGAFRNLDSYAAFLKGKNSPGLICKVTSGSAVSQFLQIYPEEWQGNQGSADFFWRFALTMSSSALEQVVGQLILVESIAVPYTKFEEEPFQSFFVNTNA